METGKLMDMVEVFEGLEDWRNAQQTRHRLSELLTIAVCAVLSGADDFEDISQWGRMKLSWLRGFLSTPTPRTGQVSLKKRRCVTR